MNFLDPKKEKLIQLLKESKQNFGFDQNGIKNRLMMSLDTASIKTPARYSFTFKILQYSAVTACLLLFVSGTFAFAAKAQPGDKLFTLNKFGEKVVLSLPLTVDQKARVEAHIVTKRLKALERVNGSVGAPTENIKLQTVKESDESLKNAIDEVTASAKKMETKGQPQNARKLRKVLNELDNLAGKHEEQIKTIEASTKNDEARRVIKEHLREIKNARLRANVELDLHPE